MADYKRNRNIILYSFVGFCVFVITFIFLVPDSSINPFLIALCLVFAYMTYFQLKSMKRNYNESDTRLTPRQKRRRELLEKDRGKVIEFPVKNIKEQRDSKSKKR